MRSDDYDGSGGYDWCIYCETCGYDEIKPHDYFEAKSDDACFVCHNRRCMYSFSETDIKEDDQGEWHCPECKSTNIMKHERCQCDIPTVSGTVYQGVEAHLSLQQTSAYLSILDVGINLI
jgi:hypothetical protein